MSPHLAFLSTAGTFRAYPAAVTVTAAAADDDDGAGMCAAVVGEAESMLIGAPIVPLETTRTEWSSYPSGVDGGTLDAGDVEVDMDDSGVSGVSGVFGEDDEDEEEEEAVYGGAPACTGTGGGIGFGGEVDGGCCDRAAKDGVGAAAPPVWAV